MALSMVLLSSILADPDVYISHLFLTSADLFVVTSDFMGTRAGSTLVAEPQDLKTVGALQDA